jgi:hypothetical protein
VEDSGPQNTVFLRVKWLGPATKGSSFVRWVRPRSVPISKVGSYFQCRFSCYFTISNEIHISDMSLYCQHVDEETLYGGCYLFNNIN